MFFYIITNIKTADKICSIWQRVIRRYSDNWSK